MASHSVAQIRSAIAAVLKAHYTTWNIGLYLSPKPEPPWMDLTFSVDYDQAMRGGYDKLNCTVRALTQWGDSDVGQAALDPLIDHTNVDSLKTVLEADETLGGTVDALRVVSVSEPKVYSTTGASELPGVDFTVEVYPNG